jgi:hypothetical protein
VNREHCFQDTGDFEDMRLSFGTKSKIRMAAQDR